MSTKKTKAKGSASRVSEDTNSGSKQKKLTIKEREKELAQLKREAKQEKKKERASKKQHEAEASAQSERDYLAAQQRAKQRVPITQELPKTPVKKTTKKTSKAKPRSTTPQGDESDAPVGVLDPGSDAGYESGASIPIDPILRGQTRTVQEAEMSEGEEPARKKAKVNETAQLRSSAKGAAHIAVAAPKELQTTVKKPQKTPIAVSSSSSDSSNNDSSDNDSSSSSEGEDDDKTYGPHTPYSIPKITNGKAFPSLKLLSPTSKAIAEDMRTKYAVHLATKDAFPQEKDALRVARQLFIDEVDFQVGGDEEADEEAERRLRRRERSKADKKYFDHMKGITTTMDSSFRGHIVSDAQPLVENEYGLLSPELDTEARGKKVMELLKNGNFAFKDWENRKGAFQCPVIPLLLRKSFLKKQVKKGYALGLGPNLQVFSEVPPALLAFLLTAVECVLMRWKTGEYDQDQFTMAKYEPIYTRHLKSMYHTETTVPGSLEPVRKAIWAQACKSAGLQPATKVKALDDSAGYMSREDLEELAVAQRTT